MRINTREELESKRVEYKQSLDSQYKQILICAGTGCVAGGSLEIYAKLKELMEQKGLACSVILEKEPHDKSVGLKKSGCHGFCEMGPLLRIEPMGWLYIKVKIEDCEEIVEKSILHDEVVERLVYKDKDGNVYKKQEEIPFYRQQTRVALEHCGHINAESITEYIATGGYQAMAKALFDMTPQEIVDEITESSLRGRGGGGFPTGRKWAQVLRQQEETKYVVCNGDEGDPGAFMDRSMMEGDPHRVIEGMIIAGIAT
ncbi:MAG TPA: NADH-quinone oxidoreductase subunit F, partial [Lachnospiraceae bacterium]|nr:NADH-quinone oxidoreductase subunit F [Lachnospiraceae bacterium]